MSRCRSFCLSLTVAAIAFAASTHDANAQPRATTRTEPRAERPATPGNESAAGGASTDIAAAPVAAAIYNLPTITYGEPMPPQPASRAFDARIPRVETVSVSARVGGRSVSRQLLVLNGRQGIESAPIREDARRLLAMHVRKLKLNESTVYFFDPQVAAEWLMTHQVGDVGPEDDGGGNDDDGCGWQNLGGCVDGAAEAGQGIIENIEAEFERLRERAENHWNDSVGALADEWDEALNCFSDHVLPGGSFPVRFDITPTMTVDVSQSGSRGAGTGSVSGSVGLGIPMAGDLQAKVDFFYIPCLPFVVRPRSITVTGDLTVGERLEIEATATGAFSKRYTIPPSGGPRIPIQVIPIVIGNVPVAVIDVSAYIEGEVELTANGSVVGTATLSNEHTSTFDFTCDGQGCEAGPGGRPTSSTPVTTTQSVQIEGKVTAKPGIYTALMLTLNVNVLGARLGPQPFLEGTATGCGAATATQTDGDQTAGAQNAALAADLDWGVDFRAEALVGGQVIGNSFRQPITEENHIWFKDLVPGGSSALRVAIAGPAEVATGQPAAYKLRMPSCYPYEEEATYRVTWTGNASPSSVPPAACDWQAGRGECEFDPRKELELRLAWPTEGSYSLMAALTNDAHRTFEPAPPATALAVAVSGAASATTSAGSGASGPVTAGGQRGGPAGSTAQGGQRGGAATVPAGSRPGPAASSQPFDIVPDPAMRGRLGRIVVAFPEKVSAPVEVMRAGETQRLADGYGDQAFDLLPGTYDVRISGKRVAGVTVRSANETRIKVGVLRVNAGNGTHVELADPASEQRVADGYGTQVFGLPIGEIGVRISGQTETVVIEAGQVTEF